MTSSCTFPASFISHWYKIGDKIKFVHIGPCLPSIKPDININEEFDAVTLSKAFHGNGYDLDTIVDLLPRRNMRSRVKIVKNYESLHNKSLIKKVEGKFSVYLERCIVSLLYNGPELDAYLLRKATKGLGTCESTLIEILCTRSSEQISQIKEAYTNLYNRPLQKHVVSDTSGSFRSILVKLINCERCKNQKIDEDDAKEKAILLYSNINNLDGDNNIIINIFCQTSYAQLRTIFQYFFHFQKITLYNFLKIKNYNDFYSTLKAIYSFTMNSIHYFSKVAHQAIKEEDMLKITRIVITRCEVDLLSIMYDYRQNYGLDLKSNITLTFQVSYPYTVKALNYLMENSS